MLTLLSTDIPWGSIEQLLWCRKGDTQLLECYVRSLSWRYNKHFV